MDHSHYSHLNIVSVIASFDSEGHVKPLYVRIAGESFKVHSSYVKACCSDILELNCQIIDQECLKPLLLTYFPHDRIWAMPRNMLY